MDRKLQIVELSKSKTKISRRRLITKAKSLTVITVLLAPAKHNLRYYSPQFQRGSQC